MTIIPEEILNSVPNGKAEKPEIKHNWLYSVVPSFAEPFGIYLAGYCRQCRNAFTVRLKEDGNPGFVLMDKLNIPVYGCEL